MRFLSTAAALALMASQAQAATIPIDLNDFFADPEVTVAADGSSADFVESFVSTVILENDPFLGDPEVILAGAGTTVSFEYDFEEAAGGNDEFFAYLFDSETNSLLGAGFEFFTDVTASGSVTFDLSTLVGTTLGLGFNLSALPGDADFNSTLTVSNLQLATAMAPVPLPATGLLLIGGLGALGAAGRRRLKH